MRRLNTLLLSTLVALLAAAPAMAQNGEGGKLALNDTIRVSQPANGGDKAQPGDERTGASSARAAITEAVPTLRLDMNTAAVSQNLEIRRDPAGDCGTVPGRRPALDVPEVSVAAPVRALVCSPPTTVQAEDDVSEWYGHRLTLHRYAAWTAVAAFPVEIYTGWRLRSAGVDPEWVRDTHRATVWVLGSTFTVNTVTGVWNWWDDRKTPEGRGWRTAHALVMLAADAAMFATARAGQARARGEGGEWHRELAFTTAGLTAIGHLMMLGPFRRD
jgi:hypothetical protein